jgi:DNA ligase-associated metallophosphoesterase
MKPGLVTLWIHDEEVMLHPRRALLWPRRRTVIVADTHFGKSGFFGRHGVPVPAGSDDEDRLALTQLVRESNAERLIILGDFLHAPLTADGFEAQELESWSRSLGCVRILVVAGNHDRGAARPWNSIEWRDGELSEPPFRFVHEASEERGRRNAADFSISGHIHPVMKLGLLRRPGLRVPVFWQRPGGLVLPSFGAFTGGFAIRPAWGEHLFAVGPTAVAQVS